MTGGKIFTRGLQDEFAGTNVRVQLVLPAATATDLWEISGVPLANFDPATVMAQGCSVLNTEPRV
jgi:short-subunit dehydrogenase